MPVRPMGGTFLQKFWNARAHHYPLIMTGRNGGCSAWTDQLVVPELTNVESSQCLSCTSRMPSGESLVGSPCLTGLQTHDRSIVGQRREKDGQSEAAGLGDDRSSQSLHLVSPRSCFSRVKTLHLQLFPTVQVIRGHLIDGAINPLTPPSLLCLVSTAGPSW